MIEFIIPKAALVCSISGAILINFKKKQGFYFYILANILWLFESTRRNMTEQCFVWVLFTILALHGIHQWNKEKRSC